MIPTPATPPRAQQNDRAIPGVTKRPVAPLRGQAPAPVMSPAEMAARQKMATMQAGRQAPMQAPAMKPAAYQQPQQAPAPLVAKATPSAPNYRAMAVQQMQAGRSQVAPAPGVAGPSYRVAAAQQGAQNIDQTVANAQRSLDARLAYGKLTPEAMQGTQSAQAAAAGNARGVGLYDRSAPIPGHSWSEPRQQWTQNDTLPPGVSYDSPGVYYDPGAGIYKYDPKAAAQQSTYTAYTDVLGKTDADYQMTPEEKAAAMDAIFRQKAQSEQALAAQMAGRGLVGSGVSAFGQGGLDAAAMGALNDLAMTDRARAAEERLNELQILQAGYGSQAGRDIQQQQTDQNQQNYEDERDYQRSQNADADAVTMINNVLGLTGADRTDPERLAAGLAAYRQGKEAFDAWVRAQSTLGPDANGATELGGPDDARGAPPGFAGDWNALSPAEKRLQWQAYGSGFDPSVPPPGSGISPETWASYTPDQKSEAYRRSGQDGGQFSPFPATPMPPTD